MVNENGFGLGTVCIIDKKVRTLSDHQIKALQILSAQVMNLLEFRNNNLELELLKAQLETQNKDLEQFAMVVSHDIKSPLASVLLTNKIIKDSYGDKLGENFNNLISISDDSAKKINSLVDGILSYYQANKNIILPEKIDINDFFESLNKTIHSSKKFNINYTNGNNVLFFSRVQLEQIFYNLINNSIRYNDKEIVQINIDLSEDNDFYKFSFKDNGIGIAKENQEKIFNLFTTLSELDNLGLKGSGIGLSTIKKIIENAKGCISVSSELGTGAHFKFTIKKIKDV